MGKWEYSKKILSTVNGSPCIREEGSYWKGKEW